MTPLYLAAGAFVAASLADVFSSRHIDGRFLVEGNPLMRTEDGRLAVVRNLGGTTALVAVALLTAGSAFEDGAALGLAAASLLRFGVSLRNAALARTLRARNERNGIPLPPRRARRVASRSSAPHRLGHRPSLRPSAAPRP